MSGQEHAALARGLRPAVAANVLLTDADGFVFRHALIREAMHDELLPGEGSQLHSRFAEAIGADPALVPPGRAAAEEAHHWYAAHDLTRALTSAWQAAVESSHALAHAEQLAMLSRVLELWEQVPGAEQRIGTGQVEVLETAMRAADLAGEFDRGITLAKAALRKIDRAAEPVRAALLLETIGHLKYQLGREDYAADLREAARLVPVDPPSAARARVLEALAHDIHHRPGGWDDAEFRAHAEEAVAVARQAGDPATEAAALVTLACAEPLTEDMAPARALLAEARAVAIRANAYQPLLRVAITESDMLEGLGQHELAARVARAGIADRPGLRAGPDLGRGAGRQPGRAAGVAGPVGRGGRGHRAGARAPPAAAEPVLALAARGRYGPGPRRPGRRRRARGLDQGRAGPHPVQGRAPAAPGPAGNRAAAGAGQARGRAGRGRRSGGPLRSAAQPPLRLAAAGRGGPRLRARRSRAATGRSSAGPRRCATSCAPRPGSWPWKGWPSRATSWPSPPRC